MMMNDDDYAVFRACVRVPRAVEKGFALLTTADEGTSARKHDRLCSLQ